MTGEFSALCKIYIHIYIYNSHKSYPYISPLLYYSSSYYFAVADGGSWLRDQQGGKKKKSYLNFLLHTLCPEYITEGVIEGVSNIKKKKKPFEEVQHGDEEHGW